MKNTFLLLLFFFINGVMFNNYFVPNIKKENNIDYMESVLLKVRQTVPMTSKIYFLTQSNVQESPEIYYKAQFTLAPRVIIAKKYEDVPRGSYMLQLRDRKSVKGKDIQYPKSDCLFTEENDFFEITLLMKNL